MSPDWVTSLYRWWSLELENLGSMTQLLPVTTGAEIALIRGLPSTLSPACGEALLALARGRAWSRLHGALLGTLRSPRSALREQRAFPGDPLPAVEELCARIAPSVLIEAVVEEPWEPLVREAAKRAAVQPELLAGMDPTNTGWRTLWECYVGTARDAWMGVPNPERVFQRLLDVVLRGEPVSTRLLQALLSSDVAHALHHARRGELWSVVPGDVRPLLLRNTAVAWLRALSTDEFFERPEPPLDSEVRTRADSVLHGHVLAVSLARYLERFPELNEREALRLLERVARPLHTVDAERLGALIAERRWVTVAARLMKKRGWLPDDLDPLLQRCASLLSPLDRILLGRADALPWLEVQAEIARIGADAYPNGVDYIWKRAGGDASDLAYRGTGRERWHKAVEKADRGALKGGSRALLEAMYEDLPESEDIKLLLMLISNRH
jgi:hypothetical protein